MEGRLEIKDRKLLVEIPFDQEFPDVVMCGLLDKAKAVAIEFIMKEHYEKSRMREATEIIKPGVIH